MTFQDHGGGAIGDCGLYGAIPDKNLWMGVDDQEDVLEVMGNGCCTLYLIGHRGGKEREGGIVTYPFPSEPDKVLEILPDPDFEEKLKEKFKQNCCKSCVINIVTCGGENLKDGKTRRKQIAINTGCTVCGSLELLPLHKDSLSLRSCMPWRYSCESPTQ